MRFVTYNYYRRTISGCFVRVCCSLLEVASAYPYRVADAVALLVRGRDFPACHFLPCKEFTSILQAKANPVDADPGRPFDSVRF